MQVAHHLLTIWKEKVLCSVLLIRVRRVLFPESADLFNANQKLIGNAVNVFLLKLLSKADLVHIGRGNCFEVENL